MKHFEGKIKRKKFIQSRIMEGNSSECVYKLVIIGESGVGKSNLLLRFTRNEYEPEKKFTVGVEFSTHTINYEGVTIRAQIWDTAGQEKYKAITDAYYRGSLGALCVYDITKKDTLSALDKWIEELKQGCDPDVTIMIVGNKCDLKQEREVNENDAAELSKKYNAFFIETSALDGTNVEKAFSDLLIQIYKKKTSSVAAQTETPQVTKPVVEERVNIAEKQPSSEPGKKGCC